MKPSIKIKRYQEGNFAVDKNMFSKNYQWFYKIKYMVLYDTSVVL